MGDSEDPEQHEPLLAADPEAEEAPEDQETQHSTGEQDAPPIAPPVVPPITVHPPPTQPQPESGKKNFRLFSEIDILDAEMQQFNEMFEDRKLVGKLCFLLGVLNLLAIIFLAGHDGSGMIWMFTIQIPVLCLVRAYLYYQTQDHYFLLDFCYLGNTVVIIIIHCANDDPRALMMAFGVAFGPLAWATILFRNSLVFHSLDRMTSCYIHILPLITMFEVRFNLKDDFSPEQTPSFGDAFFWICFVPWWIYAAHQGLQYLVVQVLCMRFNKEFAESEAKNTSYRYLTRNPEFWLAKLVLCMGEDKGPIMFLSLNLLYAFATLVVAVGWYFNKAVAFVFLIAVFSVCLWNGANFYYEVFIRKPFTPRPDPTKTS